MGKKSKGNKLAKMSEEERARYLQMRADIEEETRRRKQHLIASYMKNKLEREDAFCRLNMAKINQEWRCILRQVKCEELRNELLDLKRSCEQSIQHKDQVIRRLRLDLDIADDMQDTSFQSHWETIQNFTDIQQQRVAFIREIYEQQKLEILNEYEQDYNEWRRVSDRREEQLENVYYKLEEEADKNESEAHEKYLQKFDDIYATTYLEIEKITEKGEAKLQKLWMEYQKVLDNYLKYTEGFYSEYMELKEKDEEYTRQTSNYRHDIDKLENELAQLKILIKDTEEKCESEVKCLQERRDHLKKKLNELKLNVKGEMQKQNDRIKLLSVESYKAIKALKSHYEKIKKLTELAELCRKYETGKELQIRLDASSPNTATSYTVAKDEALFEKIKTFGNYSPRDWLLLEGYWKRISSVEIDLISLQEKKKLLEEEKRRCTADLQDYLISLNISQGRNLHVNDYLGKRPSTIHVERIERKSMIVSPSKGQCRSAKPALQSLAQPRYPYACVVEANFTNIVRLERMKSKSGKRMTLPKLNMATPQNAISHK